VSIVPQCAEFGVRQSLPQIGHVHILTITHARFTGVVSML
jgi:hypothetical protein